MSTSRWFDDYLSYLLARASHGVYKAFEVEVKRHRLTSIEWRVLAALSDGDGLTIGELAAIVLAKQPTLTKLIDRMVAQSLVAKRDDATDRRRTLVFETPRGRKIVTPLLASAKAHERELLATFPERDVETLKRILRALIARQAGDIDPPPLNGRARSAKPRRAPRSSPSARSYSPKRSSA